MLPTPPGAATPKDFAPAIHDLFANEDARARARTLVNEYLGAMAGYTRRSNDWSRAGTKEKGGRVETNPLQETVPKPVDPEDREQWLPRDYAMLAAVHQVFCMRKDCDPLITDQTISAEHGVHDQAARIARWRGETIGLVEQVNKGEGPQVTKRLSAEWLDAALTRLRADLKTQAMIAERIAPLTPLPDRPARVAELANLLGKVSVGIYVLAAHADDYKRLQGGTGHSDVQPWPGFPDTADEAIETAKRMAEDRGEPWTPNSEALERGSYNAITLDRNRWRLIREETPKLFNTLWTDLDAAITAAPTVSKYMRGLVEMPARWCTDLAKALRSLQQQWSALKSVPWRFPDSGDLERDHGAALRCVHEAMELLRHGVFEENNDEGVSQDKHSAAQGVARSGSGPRLTSAPGLEMDELAREVRQWCSADSDRLNWLRERWRAAVQSGVERSRTEPDNIDNADADAVASVSHPRKLEIAFGVVMALHARGSINPAHPPESAEALWGTIGVSGPPMEARIRDVSHLLARDALGRMTPDMARQYFVLVQTAHTPTTNRTSSKKPKVKKAEANVAARQALQENPEFANLTAREWAQKLGCSVGLVAKLPMWLATQEKKQAEAKSARPSAVTLTPKLLENTNKSGKLGRSLSTSPSENETLEMLIREQAQDESANRIRKSL